MLHHELCLLLLLGIGVCLLRKLLPSFTGDIVIKPDVLGRLDLVYPIVVFLRATH